MGRVNICIILLFSCLLVIMTPLNNYSGYVMALGLLICFFFSFNKLNMRKKTIKYCFILTLSYVLYVIFYPNKYFDVYFNNSLIMFLTAICLFPLVDHYLEKENVCSYSGIQINLIDYLYGILLVYSLFEILYFGISNIHVWQKRMEFNYQTFPFGYHHVDFSVIIMLVFMLGIKRNYYISSFILGILSMIILPSRTIKLFYLLFIICLIFRKKIYSISNYKLFDSCLKKFLWLIFGVIFISYVWIFVFDDIFFIVEGHQGLYDTSNYERFQTILYAIMVIVKKGLVLHGVDTSVEYCTLVNFKDWVVNLGPHNSFVSIFLFYSIFFGGMYLIILSKIIDNIYSEGTMMLIIPYLLCGCILHDMFIGIRILMFLTILFVPSKIDLKEFQIKSVIKRYCMKRG